MSCCRLTVAAQAASGGLCLALVRGPQQRFAAVEKALQVNFLKASDPETVWFLESRKDQSQKVVLDRIDADEDPDGTDELAKTGEISEKVQTRQACQQG